MLTDAVPERDPEEGRAREADAGPDAERPSDVLPRVDPEVDSAEVDAQVDPEAPRLGWRVLVPVVTAAAGLMFAMSFQAAQGDDLRADRDLPSLIVAGN